MTARAIHPSTFDHDRFLRRAVSKAILDPVTQATTTAVAVLHCEAMKAEMVERARRWVLHEQGYRVEKWGG